MGKSHSQGIEIGDPSIGIWSSPVLTQIVKLPTDPEQAAALHFNEAAVLLETAVVDSVEPRSKVSKTAYPIRPKTPKDPPTDGPEEIEALEVLAPGHYEAPGRAEGGYLIVTFAPIIG